MAAVRQAPDVVSDGSVIIMKDEMEVFTVTTSSDGRLAEGSGRRVWAGSSMELIPSPTEQSICRCRLLQGGERKEATVVGASVLPSWLVVRNHSLSHRLVPSC